MDKNTGANWIPPVAFYFNVTFQKNINISFQEVSGLHTELETETVKEGGVNDFFHRLPIRRKHGNLVMKRSLMPLSDTLEKAITSILEDNGSGHISPMDINVTLWDANRKPIASWIAHNAYPVKWDISPLGGQKNELVIESIEFAFTTINRIS